MAYKPRGQQANVTKPQYGKSLSGTTVSITSADGGYRTSQGGSGKVLGILSISIGASATGAARTLTIDAGAGGVPTSFIIPSATNFQLSLPEPWLMQGSTVNFITITGGMTGAMTYIWTP